jgi:hypothetical protein
LQVQRQSSSLLFCPYLVILKADSADGLGGHLEDNSDVAQDGSTATSVTLSSFASGRALYVGSAIPFRGAHIDVDGANSTGSTVITVSYWNGAEWVDSSDTDGTISRWYIPCTRRSHYMDCT